MKKAITEQEMNELIAKGFEEKKDLLEKVFAKFRADVKAENFTAVNSIMSKIGLGGIVAGSVYHNLRENENFDLETKCRYFALLKPFQLKRYLDFK